MAIPDLRRSKRPFRVTPYDRFTVCWACHQPIDNIQLPECPICGWIICPCGACQQFGCISEVTTDADYLSSFRSLWDMTPEELRRPAIPWFEEELVRMQAEREEKRKAETAANLNLRKSKVEQLAERIAENPCVVSSSGVYGAAENVRADNLYLYFDVRFEDGSRQSFRSDVFDFGGLSFVN